MSPGPPAAPAVAPAWDERVLRLCARLASTPARRTRPPKGLLAEGVIPVPAAVLVPVLPPAVLLFTHRDAGLASHAGQVCFPGGRADAGDADLGATALRETHEELGIAPAAFEIVGVLDSVFTPSAYEIAPHVALWAEGTALDVERARLAPDEVAAVYLVSFDVLCAPGVHATRQVTRGGLTYASHEFAVPALTLPTGREQPPVHVWGATGRMVRQLLDLGG